MFESGGEQWSWDDHGPLPDPPVDLPDDPEPDPVADPLDDALHWTRVCNRAEAQRALAVHELLRTTTASGRVSRHDQVAGEIAAAFGWGMGAALKFVHVTDALATRLRVTFSAVIDGRLDWYKASILAELTAPLTVEQAREVEAKTLGKAVERSPARHTDAVRRAVARIDPEGADARRRQAKRDVKLIRAHYGDGMGELFAQMASEQLDTVWTAADMWARARKADGDPRTLDQLRVASLVQWAQSFLHHGDPSYCDRGCEPGSHGGTVAAHNATGDDGDDGTGTGDSDGGGPDGGRPDDDSPSDRPGTELAPASRPPTRHGRPAALHAIWDLTSMLGLTRHCGELLDSGAMMPPEAMSELVTGGVAIRRMLIDPDSGELVDLTPRTWQLPRTRRTELDAPVVLGVILDTDLWQAINDGTADPALLEAVADAPQAVRDMLAHASTVDDLDTTPGAYPAPTRLAEFIAMRDRHPTNPTAGPTAASAADLEHVVAASQGGHTVQHNLTYEVRRWHQFKTHGGWTVQRHRRGWQWTSPRGRTYYTQPYDYRLGP
jgi:hypothetical protein